MVAPTVLKNPVVAELPFEKQSVLSLNISNRARRALNYAGIKTVGDILGKSASDIMRVRGVGKSALLDILHCMIDRAVVLPDDLDQELTPCVDWYPETQRLLWSQKNAVGGYWSRLRPNYFFTAEVEHSLDLYEYRREVAAVYAGRHFMKHLANK